MNSINFNSHRFSAFKKEKKRKNQNKQKPNELIEPDKKSGLLPLQVKIPLLPIFIGEYKHWSRKNSHCNNIFACMLHV